MSFFRLSCCTDDLLERLSVGAYCLWEAVQEAESLISHLTAVCVRRTPSYCPASSLCVRCSSSCTGGTSNEHTGMHNAEKCCASTCSGISIFFQSRQVEGSEMTIEVNDIILVSSRCCETGRDLNADRMHITREGICILGAGLDDNECSAIASNKSTAHH